MKTPRTCPNGHQYYKSSSCPVCPACEQQRKNETGFMALLSSPARRALENMGIATLQQLAGYSEKEVLQQHGIGPSSIPTLRQLLANAGLTFKQTTHHNQESL